MRALGKGRLGIAFVLSIFVALALGCGTYRTTYIVSRAAPESQAEVEKINYSHGFGLVGGGGFFFGLHRIFPCFVDWTGPVDVSENWPQGLYKVEQYHTFGQNAAAAFVSWLILLNPYHTATVEISRVR